MSGPEPFVKRRRSLTHVGGAVTSSGDPSLAALLASALDVTPAPEPRGNDLAAPLVDEAHRHAVQGARDEDADRRHVHGFHTYPARMHPTTAERLVRGLAPNPLTVLDPFCGSGTVLVEAMLAGHRALGTDLNPLAVRLAHVKTTRLDARARASLVEAARGIAAYADDRRVRRAGASRRYPREDVEMFDSHVLLELDSLRTAIADLDGHDRRIVAALELVLSAILVKVSRRASDTSSVASSRRIAAGFPAKLFARKAEELARRLAEFAERVPANTPDAKASLDDATRLRPVAASTTDLVVTSPPYVATYDYIAHHAARMRWLGLDDAAFAAGELGSRRRYAALDPAAARKTWENELARFLATLRRVCRPRATVALVLADSAVGDQPLRANELVGRLASAAGFAVRAIGSQERPHFHGPTSAAFRDVPRSEHVIILAKVADRHSGDAPW